MAKNRYVNTKFWSDGFIVELDPLERYLFLYLLTNEHTNIAGVYELPLRVMAFESGIDREMLQKMLARFSGKIEYIDGWVCIKNFTRHQKTTSRKVITGIEAHLDNIPAKVVDALIGYGYPIDRQRGHIIYSNLNFNLNSNSNLTEEASAKDKVSSLSFLENLSEEKLEALRNQYQASKTEIQTKAADLVDYCRAHGKTYKDYNALLHKSLRKDFGLRAKTSRTI